MRGRRRRPRRARGHADGRRQVALLPAAGARARRPDARRLAARLADAGPGRGAGARRARPRRARQRPAATRRANARRSARARSAASCGCSTSRRSASGRRASSSAVKGAASACSSSTRRTASRSGATTSGPTTSAWPTPRASSARGRSSPRRRPPRRRSPRDIAARLGLRDPVRVTTGFDRPNLLRRRARATTAGQAPAHRRRAGRAGRDAGDRLRGHAHRASTGWPSRCARTLGREVLAYHAGLGREPRADGAAALHDRRGRRRGRHQRVRHGRRQGRRADGRARDACPGSLEAYYQEAGRAGPRRRAGQGAAVRRGARQGPARLLHPARARSTTR